MKLWMAYGAVSFALLCFGVLVLAGCGWISPTAATDGPRVDARGNTGTVTTNITSGSSSPVGTAPCGASSTQKGTKQPNQPDCSTTTANPPPESAP